MRTGLIQSLALCLALTDGLAGFGWGAPASSLETYPTIRIHVDDYANVDRRTLMEAERVTAAIFRKAGVESLWKGFGPAANGTPVVSVDPRLFILSDIQLGILPRRMTDRLRLPDGVLGVAPGAETGRHLAYVFYDRVESLAGGQSGRRVHGNICDSASTAQILGHAMAHEIGHLLLNLKTHSDGGIMRGSWDVRTLQDACYGYLLFTREQGEAMRTEVNRRLIELRASRTEPEAADADRVISTLP
jgi:hypothetical protein